MSQPHDLQPAVDRHGRYINPWPDGPDEGSARGLVRWLWQRWRNGVPPDPPAEAFPRAQPAPAYPAAPDDELRLTFVGHVTFLVQLGGLNVLTDPHWSRRASPVSWLGPARLTAPGLPFEALPAIDAVVLSHDHYDHLDRPTVRRLARRWPDAVWLAPEGYAGWLTRQGVRQVRERTWWESVELAGGAVTATAAPLQHWTRRAPWDTRRRLWASWALRSDAGRSIYFCGDSGLFGGFRGIGARLGPFDALLLPIGAYEPRWFMKSMHMNPADAVEAYRLLGAVGLLVGCHWGAFRLTDEHPLEPPARTRDAWTAAGLPPDRLWLPAIGETRAL